MSAIFPAAVAAVLDLLQAVNNTKVTLDVDAGIGDTSITVDDASPLPSSGYLTFDDNESNPETIYYTGKAGNNLTGVTRGADSTAAGTHTAGASLAQRWNAAYHNTVSVELIAVEQNLSNRFGLGTNIVVPATRTFTLQATTNQIVLGTTNTTTISSTAPASSRTYTIPDAGGAASFVMTAGTQTIAGAKTFSAAVTITPTTNQIVLGVTNTTTISSVAPSGNRIYTIPDVGSDVQFVMAGATQTIAGAKTFSSTVTISATTNQIILGTTNTITITAPAPGSSRTYTIPDAGGAASFVMTAGAQTISGALTLTGGIVGTTAAANATAGNVGEYVESVFTSTSYPTTATVGDATSISLTAGDWDVSSFTTTTKGTVTTYDILNAITTTAGNSFAGMTGLNETEVNGTQASGAIGICIAIPRVRINVNSTTIIYLKYYSNYTSTAPTIVGALCARRIR